MLLGASAEILSGEMISLSFHVSVSSPCWLPLWGRLAVSSSAWLVCFPSIPLEIALAAGRAMIPKPLVRLLVLWNLNSGVVCMGFFQSPCCLQLAFSFQLSKCACSFSSHQWVEFPSFRCTMASFLQSCGDAFLAGVRCVHSFLIWL